MGEDTFVTPLVVATNINFTEVIFITREETLRRPWKRLLCGRGNRQTDKQTDGHNTVA